MAVADFAVVCVREVAAHDDVEARAMLGDRVSGCGIAVVGFEGERKKSRYCSFFCCLCWR